jgi:hypothetical protein
MDLTGSGFGGLSHPGELCDQLSDGDGVKILLFGDSRCWSQRGGSKWISPVIAGCSRSFPRCWSGSIVFSEKIEASCAVWAFWSHIWSPWSSRVSFFLSLLIWFCFVLFHRWQGHMSQFWSIVPSHSSHGRGTIGAPRRYTSALSSWSVVDLFQGGFNLSDLDFVQAVQAIFAKMCCLRNV